MKNAKKEKIMDVTDLKNALREARDMLFSLRLDMAVGKLKNTRSIFTKRKEIARMLTKIREERLLE